MEIYVITTLLSSSVALLSFDSSKSCFERVPTQHSPNTNDHHPAPTKQSQPLIGLINLHVLISIPSPTIPLSKASPSPRPSHSTTFPIQPYNSTSAPKSVFMIKVFSDPTICASVDRTKCLQITDVLFPNFHFSLALYSCRCLARDSEETGDHEGGWNEAEVRQGGNHS